MKTKKIIKIISLIIGVVIVLNVTGYFISKTYHKNIKSKKKMYCYQQYWGAVNPVLYVEDAQSIDLLVKYYQQVEKGDANPTFNFPPLSLPYDTCVYVINYEKDSLVAEIVCYYDWGKQGDFIKGYVYSKTLHVNPPRKIK